ncbi:alpha/beta-hydrolase [Mycena alexandri]|uniref:triacylglycerol lipase n=1 Tax=Mycena alexandri TaxID=1745969 RepID=A0AAD6SBF0_9AGAR|nr:alpha/beta-hydrolase [Mycena alexandri]
MTILHSLLPPSVLCLLLVMLPAALTSLLVSLLALLTDSSDVETVPTAADASSSAGILADNSHTLQTRRIRSYKPPSFALHAQARAQSMRFATALLQEFPLEEEEVTAPDVEERATLLELAKMSNNAYVDPDDTAWYELGANWTVSYPFGWAPDADGFRGHVFCDSGQLDGSSGTQGYFLRFPRRRWPDTAAARAWTGRGPPSAGVIAGAGNATPTSVEEALIDDSLFYPIGTNLFNNLTYMYPESDIWIIGHSLGGALASLLGATFGSPVVAFEAPGEKMAAGRLHLPSPPSTLHITHVYHNADPIAMGTCNGVLSSYVTSVRGIVYDTVSNLSWSVDVRLHGIVKVIEEILSDPWPPAVEAGAGGPRAA